MEYYNIKRKIYDEQRAEKLYSRTVLDMKASMSRNEWEKELSLRASKAEQIGRIRSEERTGADCVQAFIANMAAPSTLEEISYVDGKSLPEEVLSGSENEWTVPKWAKAGDIVFFMHSKTARTTLTRLRTELNQDDTVGAAVRTRVQKMIDHNLDIHSQYGGKIFAVGRVCGGPETVTDDELASDIFHWRSRVYASIDHVTPLTNPLDIAEFNDLVYVSRGSALTPLYDDEFVGLRKRIGEKNQLPNYLTECVARPIPLRNINAENWIKVANDYRRSFITEKQYRKFYLDYLLKSIGDQKKFYEECRCQRADIADSFMDYVIKFKGKFLPVEAKLSVGAEPHIKDQVGKYVFNTMILLDSEKGKQISGADCYPGKVLVADTDNLYMFTASDDSLVPIFTLNDLRSEDDIAEVVQSISKALN